MAVHDWQFSSLGVGMTLSTAVHGLVAAIVIYGLPSVIKGPLKVEASIAVALITPDNAVGYSAPDLERNIWPGNTAAEIGVGQAAPEGDLEDAPLSPTSVGDAPQSAPAKALEGAANDLEGRDALPRGDVPGIAAAAAPVASRGPVIGERAAAEQPLGAPLRRPVAAPAPGDEMVVAQYAGGQATPSDQPVDWMPAAPRNLADISDYLSRGLARLRQDIENGEIPPETLARELLADAEQGNLESQYTLAALYQLGLGVPEDPAEALAWYRTAAEKRFVDAQIRLGEILATGKTAAALVEAQSWWRVAAETGEPLAVAGAALLADQLSPAQNAEARTKAQRIEKLWKSWESWSAADSGGALEDQLIAAAGAGDGDAIKRLIDAGANPNTSDARGRSALLLSAMAGHDDAALALLRRGAQVETADADGKTALMWASDAGHLDVAKLLLKRGADIAARDKYGQTALIDAAWRGRDKVVKMLLTINADANARSTDGVTALMWTAINGYPETARQLIAAGAAVDALDKGQFTPLIRAAWNGHTEVVALLIEAGAQVNAKSRDGKTALRLSHSGGLKEIVALLRAAGATR
jgi:ankyrin repeat protein